MDPWEYGWEAVKAIIAVLATGGTIWILAEVWEAIERAGRDGPSE